MINLETKIIINASPKNIWNKLMDFEKYPQWNPFIKSIVGPQEEGANLKVNIEPPGGKVMTFKPKLLKLAENKEFRWKGKTFIKGLFDGEHYFILKELEQGKTEFIHGENFTGLLSSFLMKKIGAATRSGFEAMNTALKNALES